MKVRHSSSLALVAWYLLLAPVHNGQARSAPLREWRTLTKVFVSDADCEAYRKQTAQNFEEHRVPGLPPELEKLNAHLYGAGVCIASDDPRLKPN
jgi:hypothetical protein